MMSLVDYGGSSASDSENDDTQEDANAKTKEIKALPVAETTWEIKDLDEAPSSNFQCANDEVEESLKMRVPGNIKLEEIIKSKPRKKKKGKVLINMPKFEDSDSDEDTKKASTSSRVMTGPRKGLTSLLPPPKAMIVREGNRPMIPHSVARKPAPTKPKPKPKPQPTEKEAEEDEPVTSFFTLEDDEVIPEMPPPRPPPQREEEAAPVAGPSRPAPEEMSASSVATLSYDQPMPVDFIPQIELRNQRKRKRDEPIDMIDIRQSDLTAGVEIELTKGISQEEDEFKKTQSENMPGRLAAAKHQITWLAYKAKEQEFELKNSWATAKYNKMQTRNKYGF